uniref:Uncharacterized protein n=1 Tax=viral metagenome TaxID=1070528 RepID=A0A6C0C2A7_9ZZZZ
MPDDVHVCRDINNKIDSCQDYGTPCIGEGMGGHPGSFTDIYVKDGDKCLTACGKKIESKDSYIEYNFYMNLFDNTKNLPEYLKKFREFLPKFYRNDSCKKEWEEGEQFWLWGPEKKRANYFVFENIKSSVGKNAKTLDFKLGKKTAFKFDKGSFGNVRHIILDSDMSRSKSQGFRLEGATDGKEIVEEAKKNKKISGWFHTTPQDVGKKQTNSALYTLHANFVWNKFIENKEQASSLKQQLNELDDKFVMPNMEAETKNEESIGFIGSSILIVKGDGGIKFKLIDFAHPFWSHPTMSKNQHHKEVVLNYNEGLKMFIEIYNKWYNDKYFDEPPPMPAAPPAPVPTVPAPVPTVPVSAPPPSVPSPVTPPVGGKRRTKKKKRRKRKKRKTKRKRKRK